MDGQSTDGTLALLRGYGDRIRWRSQKDAGQSEAVNDGVALADGEIIAWINSDDYYPHARVLPRVLEAFRANEQLDIVYGDGLMVDVGHQPIRVHGSRPIESARQILLHPASFVMQPAVFFRRSLFLAAGGLEVGLRWTMDYELWLRLFPLARKTLYMPSQLACATYHADAKSVRSMLLQIGELAAVKRRYSSLLRVGRIDRVLMEAGIATLYAYWVETRIGLKRAS